MDVIASKKLGSVDGFDLEARIVPDTDTTVGDYDCYTKKQIAAWRNDEWSYVGTIVVASKAGVELGEAALWGSEYGRVGVAGNGWISPLDGEGESFVNGYGPSLIAEALDAARETLAKIIAE